MISESAQKIQQICLDPQGHLFTDNTKLLDLKLLTESYERLQLIYSIGQRICGTTNLELLLEEIIRAIERSVPCERCFIASRDNIGKLTPLIAHNIELSDRVVEWPISKTILSRAIEEGVSILSADTIHDERFLDIKSVFTHRIHAVICIPLGAKGSHTGVIYADSMSEARSFSELDLRFLTALSHYIDLSLRNAEEFQTLKSEQHLSQERCATLQQELLGEHKIIGSCQNLLKVYQELKRAAQKEVSILLLGETGTGKELFAKAAHKLSKRGDKVYMPLNIAELSETIIESELFGHEKGAFSGALGRKVGRLEMSNGGTLFLDEVAEIPLHIQAKLLRVLETGEFMRVGGSQWIHTDMRLICATNKGLEELVRDGRFRKDLFYRLKGATINIPALRERSQDIPELVTHALKKIGSNKFFSSPSLEVMKRYSWPGNVRQLIHLVQELDAVCESDIINLRDLPVYIGSAAPQKEDASHFPTLQTMLSQVEEEHFRKALAHTNGNNEQAIKLLGIARATFFERKRRYGL